MKVFISYSWNSQTNIDWVHKLASKLKDDGIDVIIDKNDLHPGENVNQFMEKIASEDVNKVLVICDKNYKEDADSRNGNVGREVDFMAEDIKTKKAKYIPIVYDPDQKECIPTFLSSILYLDFRKGFDQAYNNLLMTLIGENGQKERCTADSHANSLNVSLHSGHGSNIILNSSPDIIKYKGYFYIDIEKSALTRGERWSRLELVFQNVTDKNIH